MNWAALFMALQVLVNTGGVIGFLLAGRRIEALIWFFYAGSQVGWTLLALKGSP